MNVKEMGDTCGGKEKRVQGFGGETWTQEATCKTSA
jgi:hypothetical protein